MIVPVEVNALCQSAHCEFNLNGKKPPKGNSRDLKMHLTDQLTVKYSCQGEELRDFFAFLMTDKDKIQEVKISMWLMHC